MARYADVWGIVWTPSDTYDVIELLVTGSDGYIGSNLVRGLKNEGDEVIPFDLKEGNNILNGEKFEEKSEMWT